MKSSREKPPYDCPTCMFGNVTELEKTAIPELRGLIASGLRKDDRDELKQDEAALKTVLEKLKMAA